LHWKAIRKAAVQQALAVDRLRAREIVPFLKSFCAARLGGN
jgi:hypothetical protein